MRRSFQDKCKSRLNPHDDDDVIIETGFSLAFAMETEGHKCDLVEELSLLLLESVVMGTAERENASRYDLEFQW